jgi:Na+-driven multidrug efflux pump
MLINLLALWLIQVPLAYLLSRGTALEASGIWWALTVGWVVHISLAKNHKWRDNHPVQTMFKPN